MNDPFNQNYDYLVTENDTKNDTELTEKKHSKCGVISFILSIFLFIAYIFTFAIIGYLASQDIDPEDMTIIIGFCFILLFIIHIVSIVLGLIGSIQSTRKRLFGILGLIFSLAILAILVALFAWAFSAVGVK